MAKRTSTKKPPISKKGVKRSYPVGTRILAGDKYGTITNNHYSSYLPYEITWENGRQGYYKERDFQLYGFQILPESGDIEEKAAQLDLNFPREQQWRVGARCTTLPTSDWQPGELIILKADNPENIRVESPDFPGKPAVIAARFLQPCKTSKPAESLKGREDLSGQLSLLEDLTGESQLKTTKTRSQSSTVTSSIKSSEQISETFTQAPESMISSVVDSHASAQVEQALVKDSLTQSQPCLESSCDVSVKLDLSSSSSSNLWDLSIKELELGLEQSRWLDIQASIRSSLDAINLERNFGETESLSFPTLLSGRGRGCRDAGLVECEKWWKANVIQTIGLQLSSEAIALLHGFPANWYRSISPPSVAPLVTQDDSPAGNLEDKPSPFPKPELPSNGSNGYGQSFKSEWQIGDRVELVETMEFNRRKLGETGTITEVRSDAGIPRFVVTWDKKRPKVNNTTMFLAQTKSIQLIDQYPAVHQSTTNPSEKFKSEEELTPVDESAIGKHFWCDRLDVAVQVETVHNWRTTPHAPEITKAARARPWWTHDKNGERLFPDCLVIPLSDLEEIEEFSRPLPERARIPAPDIKDSLGKSRIQPEKESQQTGSLYQYTSNKANKEGVIQTYPLYIGEGERPRDDESLWYWGISWVEKVKGKWRDRSSSIPRSSLPLARRLMREKFPVATTVSVCQIKWLWQKEIGSYLVGETRPEVCPRLAILSMTSRELFTSGPSWGEQLPLVRQQRREAIEKAIAEGKPFSYIKELLCNA